jgi:hypothetical protein
MELIDNYGTREFCHANRDGECDWEHCPQLRDGEPIKTARHCPLDIDEEDYLGGLPTGVQ